MIVLVMDQALYAIAAEIILKQRDQFSNIVLRMDTFHTICIALSILGKIFANACLKHICIKVGLVAEGTITHVV